MKRFCLRLKKLIASKKNRFLIDHKLEGEQLYESIDAEIAAKKKKNQRNKKRLMKKYNKLLSKKIKQKLEV